MKLKITDKNGMTLYTAGKYFAENIEVGVDPNIFSNGLPDGYIIPEGSLNIAANGTHDVTSYASVNVEVPIPDGYIIPSGNFVISENGNYNISDKESVTVLVEGAGVSEDYLAAAMNDTLTTYKTNQVNTIRGYSFYGNTNLQTLDTTATTIASSALNNCSGLTNLVLRGDSVASLASSSAFASVFYDSSVGVGHIFVPDNLVSSYKSATNWSSTSFSSKIYPLSTYDAGLPYITNMEVVQGTVGYGKSSQNPNRIQFTGYGYSTTSSCKLHIHVPEGCSSFSFILDGSNDLGMTLYEIDDTSTAKATSKAGTTKTTVTYDNITPGDHFVFISATTKSNNTSSIYAYFRALPMN